jgi:histidinol-phosphate/aromatic aminotransferase/cobyric acid decarboxylase-like protein
VGSDEAIDLLFRIFCAPGKDAVMTTPPTYGMYKVCANVNDVQIVTVPLSPDFDLRIPEVSTRTKQKGWRFMYATFIFICLSLCICDLYARLHIYM